MDREIDFSRFGFKAGDKVILADDEWPSLANEITVLDAEPVPGSTQCVIQAGGEIRTVSRCDLLPA